MEPFSPLDSEYRCNTFDGLPRGDVRPHRRSRVPVLVTIVAVAVLGYLIAWPLTGGGL